MSARDSVKSSNSDPNRELDSWPQRLLTVVTGFKRYLSHTACGLRLCDEATWVAVALHLDAAYAYHILVDADHCWMPRDFMAWSARIIRHQALNVVARTIQSAGILITKEPVGLTRLDDKKPDGLTLIPWLGGKPLTWNVTVVSTLAASYLSSAWSAGAVADLAVSQKRRNIRASPTRTFFSPSQWNPTVCAVHVPSPSSPLWANA